MGQPAPRQGTRRRRCRRRGDLPRRRCRHRLHRRAVRGRHRLHRSARPDARVGRGAGAQPVAGGTVRRQPRPPGRRRHRPDARRSRRGHRRGRVGRGQRPARGDDPRDVAAVPRVPRPALRPVLGGVRGCRPAGAHPLRSCGPRAVRPAHRHLPDRGAVVGGAPVVVPDLVRGVRASSPAQVRHHRGRCVLGQRHPLAHGHPLPGRAHLEEDEPGRHRRSSSP